MGVHSINSYVHLEEQTEKYKQRIRKIKKIANEIAKPLEAGDFIKAAIVAAR